MLHTKFIVQITYIKINNLLSCSGILLACVYIPVIYVCIYISYFYIFNGICIMCVCMCMCVYIFSRINL